MGEILTFETHDKLHLKGFSEKLERFLIIEHEFVGDSLVVSLNAPFGGGKTTFLSMWKSDLDKRRKEDKTVPKAVIINAWESDYCGDPLLSIVSALIKAADGEESNDTEPAGRLREAAKDVGWFVTGLANNIVSHWTGIDPISAGELAEEKKQGRRPKIPDFVSLYKERTRALENLKKTLREVFGGETPKAFIFIDELDRCRPDYAISYLETIKHVFDVHGLVFILAADHHQLECSAKALFGIGLKFSDYFRKFAHRTVGLPEPEQSNLKDLANHYVRNYLELEGRRITLMSHLDYRVDNIVLLITALRMPPRQIQEMFRIIGHTMAGDMERRGRLYWCIGVGVILMSALKVAGHEMYGQIGQIKVTHREVGDLLKKLLGKEEAHWWFCIYLTGSSRKDCPDEASLIKLFQELQLVGATESSNWRGPFQEFAPGWGCHWSGDRWQQIYQMIETANAF